MTQGENPSRILSFNTLQCLVEDDVIGIFQSHAEADEVTAELLGILIDTLIIPQLAKDDTIIVTKRYDNLGSEC